MSEMKNSLVVSANSESRNSHQMFISETMKHCIFYSDMNN